MSRPIEIITEEALALPSDARAQLADRLAESLDPINDNEIHDLWVREALTRWNDIQSGKVKPIPADVALARINALLKQPPQSP